MLKLKLEEKKLKLKLEEGMLKLKLNPSLKLIIDYYI